MARTFVEPMGFPTVSDRRYTHVVANSRLPVLAHTPWQSLTNGLRPGWSDSTKVPSPLMVARLLKGEFGSPGIVVVTTQEPCRLLPSSPAASTLYRLPTAVKTRAVTHGIVKDRRNPLALIGFASLLALN